MKGPNEMLRRDNFFAYTVLAVLHYKAEQTTYGQTGDLPLKSPWDNMLQ